MNPLRSVSQLTRGPHPVLPRPLDTLSERWARLRPRARTAVVLLALVAVAVAGSARVRQARTKWGGEPVEALVASKAMPVGTPARGFRRVTLPPRVVPPDAVRPRELSGAQAAGSLALALPEGAVLTGAHLSRRGPAVGLAPGLRALPVPVEPGWGTTAGSWVDVWVLGTGEQPASQVASARPVLEVRGEGRDKTALVGLSEDEVAAATTGLALGKVLLTHAPAPSTSAQPP